MSMMCAGQGVGDSSGMATAGHGYRANVLLRLLRHASRCVDVHVHRTHDPRAFRSDYAA